VFRRYLGIFVVTKNVGKHVLDDCDRVCLADISGLSVGGNWLVPFNSGDKPFGDSLRYGSDVFLLASLAGPGLFSGPSN
jgi:hypothetical protein